MDKEGAVLICRGRLFQSLGAAMENALSPLVFSLDLGTVKRSTFADLKRLFKDNKTLRIRELNMT